MPASTIEGTDEMKPTEHDDTLERALMVTTLQAINEHTKTAAAAMTALAQASFESSKALARLVEVMSIDQRVKDLEKANAVTVENLRTRGEAMDRHRNEHRLITGAIVSLLLTILGFFIKYTLFK